MAKFNYEISRSYKEHDCPPCPTHDCKCKKDDLGFLEGATIATGILSGAAAGAAVGGPIGAVVGGIFGFLGGGMGAATIDHMKKKS